MNDFIIGKKYKFSIIGEDHYGRGIAKFNRYPIFIPYTLKGELIEAEITNVKKNYAEAIPTKLITVSKERKEICCDKFLLCGGCNILHQEYNNGLEFKMRMLKELLYKIGKIDVTNLKINDIVPCDNYFNYRNKVSFHVEGKKIGFYKNKTNELLDIKECKIINPIFNKTIKIIRKHLFVDSKIKGITLRYGINTDELMIIFDTNENINEQIINDLLKNIKEIKSVYRVHKGKYTLIYGERYIYEKLLGMSFRISPNSFFQVNTIQAEKMFLKVKKSLLKNDKNILDLYCGTGVISLIISEEDKKIIGVDVTKEAIKDANINKKINKIDNVKFIAEKVVNVLPVIKKAKKSLDVIILDPPRIGIDDHSIKIINELYPKKIIYISCNPSTLARDLNILKEEYIIKEITPFDLFPLTHHVECVCVLNRR